MDKPEKAPNYTPELVEQIVADYAGGTGLSVKDIAVKYNRSVRSITGKLVNLGVYVKAETPVKENVDTGPSKKDYLAVLESLGFSGPGLDGLKNATKPALAEVIERIKSAA
jgi:hypothetical protein